MKPRAMAVVSGLLVASTGWVFAAAATESPEPQEEEVVVTARKATKTRVETPASVSVITREDIERSNSRNLMELLSRQPGVFVRQQSGVGYMANVQIRGLGGNPPAGNLVLIDGHPDYMGIMGHGMPRAQTLDSVERVEIVRGPASVAYGSMALGGVVHIITRDAPERLTARAQVDGGSFGTTNGHVWVGTALGGLSLAASGGRFRTDGHLDNDWAASSVDDYGVNADMRWSPNLVTRFRGRVSDVDTLNQTLISTQLLAGRPDAAVTRMHQRWLRRDLGLTTEMRGGNTHSSFGIFWNPSRHKFDLPDGFDAEDYVAGASWLQDWRASENLGVSWGLDWLRAGGRVKNPQWPFARRVFGRSEGGATLGLSYVMVGGEKLSAALRVQMAHGIVPHYLPSVGIEIPTSDGGSARMSLRSGYRAPSFRELFLFAGANPYLRPEQTWQLEVGRRVPLPGGELDAAVYHIQARDLIQTGPRPAYLPQTSPTANINVPMARLRGLEVAVRRSLRPDLTLFANYSYLEPGALKAYNVRNKGTVGLEYRRGRFRWSADALCLDKVWGFDAASRLTQVPGSVVLNTKMTYDLSGEYRLSLGVDNLLDHHYTLDPSLHKRLSMPGRYITIGLRAQR